jgi:hypothetical protein
MYLHLTLQGIIAHPGELFTASNGQPWYVFMVEWQRTYESKQFGVRTEYLHFLVRLTGKKALRFAGRTDVVQNKSIYIQGHLTTIWITELAGWRNGTLPKTIGCSNGRAWIVIPEHFDIYDAPPEIVPEQGCNDVDDLELGKSEAPPYGHDTGAGQSAAVAVESCSDPGKSTAAA